MTKRKCSWVAGGLIGVLVFGGSAGANELAFEAVDNSTVRPDGPRGDDNNINFFNVEGSDHGAFASYGVADFEVGVAFAVDAGDVTGVNLRLM